MGNYFHFSQYNYKLALDFDPMLLTTIGSHAISKVHAHKIHMLTTKTSSAMLVKCVFVLSYQIWGTRSRSDSRHMHNKNIKTKHFSLPRNIN
jgi:hypothetical protein